MLLTLHLQCVPLKATRLTIDWWLASKALKGQKACGNMRAFTCNNYQARKTFCSRSGYDWGRRQLYRWFHLRPVTRRLSTIVHRVCSKFRSTCAELQLTISLSSDLDGSEDDPTSGGDPTQEQTRTPLASAWKEGEDAQTCWKKI